MSNSYTILKNPIIAKKDRQVFSLEPDFSQGQLYYHIPEKATRLERFIVCSIIGICLFLFWKNIF